MDCFGAGSGCEVGPSLRAANYIPRFSLEDSGPGGIKSGWDQVAKREQGGGMQNFVCTPCMQLGLVQ